MSRKYVIGLDYGTESGRALLVAVDNGEEVATAVQPYPDGVIDVALPGSGRRLEPDWALQNPKDYLYVIEQTIPKVLEASGVSGEDVIGIGTDFTACTMMPIDAAGTPLCMKPEFANEPHAWVKLWKHHAAQPEADRINALAAERGEAFLARYGGKISSEWFFPKALQILDEAPEIYAAADRLIEASDWIVLQLCGEEKRNACVAGYKAIWDEGYPSPDFFKMLDPRFENVVADKMSEAIYPAGVRAGGLLPEIAAKVGLKPGTAVATGGVDAHVAVPAATVTDQGKLVMIMGTSICHMVCGAEKKVINGMCGVVKDGILPGYYGFEAGQTAVGDIYAWFVDECVPAAVSEKAAAAGMDVHQYLSAEAEKLAVGESGVLALDWWNGNRSILVDADLTGLMVGMTLTTTPAEMYRAILESTAFGTYKIVKQLEQGGVPILELYACGGLPAKNPFLMQIFADVTNREIKVSASDQTVALGSAMWGAVAAGSKAGGYDSVTEAATRMARLRDQSFTPNPQNHAMYEQLFAEYERLHDLFGRGGDNVMKNLKAIKLSVRGAGE
ncbi:MAG TPA: ribulokinase [Candidatus Hydrogenedentes bacterium]|nr:ribulokinase [Candidatus Hydrogenedentota bacterium]HPG67242.1 ribulokinase [Candidatus Hydrogenedentota bacterium]